MKSRKTSWIAAVCVGASLLLSSCSNTGDVSEDVLTPTSTVDSAPAPEAPLLGDNNGETVTADGDVAKKLKDLGSPAQDDWFIKTVRGKGVSEEKISDTILLGVRGDVCSAVKRGYTLTNIVNGTLKPYDLSDEESGAIIGASLVSQCPEGEVHVASTTTPTP